MHIHFSAGPMHEEQNVYDYDLITGPDRYTDFAQENISYLIT